MIARDALPAPPHLARTLLGYRHLTAPERWSAVRTALRLRRLDPDAPELDERSFRWNGYAAEADELARVRAELFHSIGSCSFFEPVEELRTLEILA